VLLGVEAGVAERRTAPRTDRGWLPAAALQVQAGVVSISVTHAEPTGACQSIYLHCGCSSHQPAAPPPATLSPRFACHWESVGKGMSAVTHVYFSHSCMAMPHLAHMAFAVVVSLVFMLTSLGLVRGGLGGGEGEWPAQAYR
jgi:hypothetical protein